MSESARQSARIATGAVATLAVALAVSLGVIALLGHSPSASLNALATGAFGDRLQIATTLAYAVPLALVALGWIVAFRAGRISIGFEGQIVAGGIAATAVSVHFSGLPQAVHLPLGILAGTAAGAGWAGIAAWLWAKRGVNEIISTLLLNFIAIQVLSWAVQGPLQEPTHTLPASAITPPASRFPTLLSATPLSWDVLALAAALLAVLLLPRTSFGIGLRMTGLNAEAAEYAGIRPRRVGVVALIASGALGGLAGTCMILGGALTSLSEGFSGNVGFEGIVVALLVRNRPLGAMAAAVMLSALIQGGGYMEATVDIPADLVLITQGIVILLVTAPLLLRVRRRRAPTTPPRSPQELAATAHTTQTTCT